MRGRVAAALIAGLLLATNADAQRSSASARRTTRATAIRSELAAVLLQSKRYGEAAREYRALLEHHPQNHEYRLGLARALAWGRRLREAERELLALRTRRPGDPVVDTLLTSVRLGLSPSSGEAAGWLAERPGFVPYRRALARALVREKRYDDAFAHYDTLLAERRDPDILIDRAYAHLARRDLASVETDLAASIASGPRPQAYLFLGDLHRWRGSFAASRAAYLEAGRIGADRNDVAAGLGQLAREERPAPVLIAQGSDASGWQVTGTSASDNLGVTHLALDVRRGVATFYGVEASVAALARSLSEDAVTGGAGGTGIGAGLGASRAFTRGNLLTRLRATGALVRHQGIDLAPEGAFTAALWLDAWSLTGVVATGPAYPSLLTAASFAPLADGRQLQARDLSIAVAGPLRRLDAAAGIQRTLLGDGNRRVTLQAHARYPLSRGFTALYSGSAVAFSRPSAAYWDPVRSTSNALGIEAASRSLRGFSLAVRALPGLAWSDERGTTATFSRGGEGFAFVLAAGAEASYRSERWELGAAMTYGRGRGGAYERGDGIVQVRLAP